MEGLDYQRLFEAAHESQLLLDRSGRVVTASDGYLRSIDRTRASIIGQAMFELPPYAGEALWSTRLREALDAMQRAAYPVGTIVLAHGEDAGKGLWSHAKLSAIPDAAGRVEYVVHVLELTAGGSEQSESDSERRLRKLIGQTYDAVVLFDAHGRIVYASPSIERVLGFSPQEFAELGAIEATHPDDRAGFGAELGQLFEEPGGHLLTRFRARHRDGHWCTIENAVVNMLHDPDIAAFISTSRDVSKQVELQEQLLRSHEESRLLERRMQESQKLESLGVLAGGIAHDFNNLLMVILGSVSLVQRELDGAHPTLAHVVQIEEASRRAADLCRQLLAYAGKGRFLLEHVSLNRLIDETTSLLQVSISKKAVLRLHLDAASPAVFADATQLRQVLMNLVINASDAVGDQPGMISIRTGIVSADRTYLEAGFVPPDLPPGDYAYLEVSDSGAGMSPETQARIFEPFFTTKFTGRGLGLAAVLGIVRGHKGALKVYSELGKGSSFKLLLPAGRNEPARPRAERIAETLPNAGGTILIVDDDINVRKVTSHLVEGLGFRTLEAADGAEALRIYREHASRILCVLMDLTMPRLDGEETFRELRKLQPDVRVLLMSGYNEQDAIARFVGKGLAGFIQKPFMIEELEKQLQRLLSDPV